MKVRTSIDDLLSEREKKNLAILDLIRKKGPISKADIAKSVDTNIVTVSNYIDSYIRKDLLFESGLDISSGGRKPTLVEMSSRVGFAIGINLNALDSSRTETVALLCDLSGEEVARIENAEAKELRSKSNKGLPVIINKIIEKAGIERDKLKGIGVGIRGENKGEDIRLSIKEGIEKSFNLPVFIGYDSVLAAFGEKMLGPGENFENIIYMYSDIGCGIIIKGNIYCGAGGSAGGMGVDSSEEKDFFPWARGPYHLRSKEGDFGISSRAKRVIEAGDTSLILKLAKGDPGKITLDLVIEAAQKGDRLAEELIENAGVELGIRVAYLINLFNPEVVIIGGGIERAGSLILEPVKKTVKRWAFEESTKQTKILPAHLGKEAVAWGAASIVMREVFIKA